MEMDKSDMRNLYKWWLQTEQLLTLSPPEELNWIFSLCLAKNEKEEEKITYSLFLKSKMECQKYLLPTHTQNWLYWLVFCSWWWNYTLLYGVNTCTTLTIRKPFINSVRYHLLIINNKVYKLVFLSCRQPDDWAQSDICVKTKSLGKECLGPGTIAQLAKFSPYKC